MRRTKDNDDSGYPINPDVLFILVIVLFWFVSLDTKDEQRFTVPFASANGSPSNSLTNDKPWTVAIDEKMDIYLEGTPVDSEDLAGTLAERYQDNHRDRKTVVVQCHADVEFGFFSNVWSTLVANGNDVHVQFTRKNVEEITP